MAFLYAVRAGKGKKEKFVIQRVGGGISDGTLSHNVGAGFMPARSISESIIGRGKPRPYEEIGGV